MLLVLVAVGIYCCCRQPQPAAGAAGLMGAQPGAMGYNAGLDSLQGSLASLGSLASIGSSMGGMGGMGSVAAMPPMANTPSVSVINI